MSTKDFSLLWVSKCTYPAKHIVYTNFHEYYQVVFILGGEGKIIVDGSTYDVKVNELYIFKPNVKHSILASKIKSLNTVELKFFCNNVTSEACLNQLAPLVEDNDESVCNAFINIINEVKTPDIHTENMISLIINQIIIYLTRSLYRKAEQSLKNISKVDSNYSSKNKDPLYNVINYIKEKYYQQIKLNDLAKMAYLSPVYFCSIFKEKYGVSPIQYLQNIRLDNARKLLCNTDESVTKISEKVGFQSVHYFSRFFKAREGLSPNEYRRRHQGFIYKDFNGNITQL